MQPTPFVFYQVKLSREVVAEVAKLAMLWDVPRYQACEKLLREALQRVKESPDA